MHREVVIVGGGLAGTLLALALRERRPLLVESGPTLGGNHLWSFHAGDVPERGRPLAEPLIVARWPAYEVRFPDFQRRIDDEYASISSQRLHEVAAPQLDVLLESRAQILDARTVRVGGVVIEADRLYDCRAVSLGGECAYQTFRGIEVRTRHGLEVPTLMDARGPQQNGFEFVYRLPLSPDTLLVENTRFSTSPELPPEPVHEGEVLRREEGVLPLPLQPWTGFEPQRLGYGGGYFHPVTGYSLPVAVRVALRLAEGLSLEGPWLRGLRRQQQFAVRLNRLLYRACAPEHRWQVLSRFHRLPRETIRRFYALETTAADRARIVCGRPPKGISLHKAIGAWA